MKKIISILRTLTISTLIALLILLLSDLSLHSLLKEKGGYNYQGYRGDLGNTNAELKIACFGGSTTYGFGVPSNESWPAQLQKILSQDNLNITVFNLGTNGQGIKGIKDDLEYYDYLDYDIALIYNGYNDLYPSSLQQYSMRKEDIIFRNFGYKPIIPDYINDKLLLNVQFKNKINFTQKNKMNLHESVQKYIANKDSIALQIKNNKKTPYQAYINCLDSVITTLHKKQKTTIFICPPGLLKIQQQKIVQEHLNKKNFENVYYLASVNDSINITNTSICFDGMHLNKTGNLKVASIIKSWLIKNVLKTTKN